jgi:hypothetical protein
LVSSSSVGEPLAQALSGYGLAARFMSSSQFDLAEPCIKVTTLHAAKGLEFPIVVVAHVEAGRLPRETEATDPMRWPPMSWRSGGSFMWAARGPCASLLVTYDRQLPSPFLADLSEAHWQREGSANVSKLVWCVVAANPSNKSALASKWEPVQTESSRSTRAACRWM